MSDAYKVLTTLILLSETCDVSVAHLSGSPSLLLTTPTHPLAVLRKDFLSLLSLVYTSATKISLTLTASKPAYGAAYPVVKDYVAHVSSLTTCATLFDEHGATVAGDVRKYAAEICAGTRGLSLALTESVTSLSAREDHDKEYLVRTGAIHEAVERIRKELPEDNLSAVRTRWKVDNDMLQDSLVDVNAMIDDGASEDDEDDDEGFGSDDDALGELGFTNKKLSEEELERAKKIQPLLRICVLLHERVLTDALTKSNAANSTLDSLPPLSHNLLLATEEVVAALYAPQDPTAMSSALEPILQDIHELKSLLLDSDNNLLPPLASLEDRMAVMSVGETGKKEKDVRKWFGVCFAQIHKLYTGLRNASYLEGNPT